MQIRTWIFLGVLLGVSSGTWGCGGSRGNADVVPPTALSSTAEFPAISTEPGPAQIAGGYDWPCWRGVKNDGISLETGWVSKWPDSGPPKLWSRNIGTGFSGMTVVDGRVYTMGHRDGQDTVYCLDSNSGEPLWTHSYECQIVDNLHEGGPACTPTVDGDRVYTISKEGHLICFAAKTGAVQWQIELQKTLGVEMPQWGFSGSPLVYNDMLLIEAGRVCAINKNDGQLIWQGEKYKSGYGSVTLMPTASGMRLLALNNEYLLLLNAADGKEIAKTPWVTSFDTSACTPMVEGAKVFISTGYDTGCALFEVKDDKFEKLYAHKKMRNHMANCVNVQNILYGYDGNSHARRTVTLTAMDHDTGEIRWKQRGLGCGTILASDGKLILLGDEGELVVAEATPEAFKPISRAQVIEGKCWTVPTLSQGRLYIRTALGEMVCLNLRSAETTDSSEAMIDTPDQTMR